MEAPAQQLPQLLVVEDNLDVATYIKDTFAGNYTVLEARNGQEGLQLAIKHVPDLVISDLMMPKMDGLELCHRLKTEECTSHIPLILLTAKANVANADFDVEAFGKEVGMSRMQLHRKLKALTDQSPGEFIRSFRLKRAVMLLTQNYGNISEVAFSVGFNSLTYFTKCFREQYRQSPSEYLAGQNITAQP